MMKAVTATTSGELVISVCMQHLTSGRHAKPQVIGLLSLTTLLFVSDRMLNLLTRLLSPAVGFLDRWLPCIFMPYIVAAAMSTIPTGTQLIKALAFIVSSFILVLHAPICVL
jgi:hypothetical protein